MFNCIIFYVFISVVLAKAELENEDESNCFSLQCLEEKESCFANDGCAYVAEFGDVICENLIQCIDPRYAIYVACDGDTQCGSLVSSAANCYFKQCESDCIATNCTTSWDMCVQNTECQKSLQLFYAGICNELDCFDSNIQLELCQESVECQTIVSSLAECYQSYCAASNSTIASYNTTNTDNTNNEINCTASSGVQGIYDDYGTCCKTLGKVDCLWDEDDSICGWFYSNGTGYCNGLGNVTCKQILNIIPVTTPLSCQLDGDCGVEECAAELQRCGENDKCLAGATILKNNNQYDTNTCQEDVSCLQLFQNLYSCYISECNATIISTSQPTTTNQATIIIKPATTTNREVNVIETTQTNIDQPLTSATTKVIPQSTQSTSNQNKQDSKTDEKLTSEITPTPTKKTANDFSHVFGSN